jgi:hypothetical protein
MSKPDGSGLRRAIEIAGGQTALAAAIGVRQSHISYWLLKSESGVPAERALDIERATGVGRHELRPDLFATPGVQLGPGLADEGAPFTDEDDGAPRSVRGRNHFSRFKHLRRTHFQTQEEIERHVRALREEWDRR